MSVEERDNYTGHMTTGHSWNGIKELNTPVPLILIFFLCITFIASAVYWYLMPTWPTGKSFTPGALGLDQRDIVEEQQAQAQALQSSWVKKITQSSFDDIKSNDALMNIVSTSGPALYQDNCAMCHGQQGEGSLYFPKLSDENWLWGGEPDSIYYTLQYGINAGVENTRLAQMPAFGAAGTLDGEAIANLTTYVLSLSDTHIADGTRANETLAANNGKRLFASNCAACHAKDATGNSALGAPNLRDAYWLYGGTEAAISESLQNGRGGHMPEWKSRLSDVQLKILTLYVESLSKQHGPSPAN